MLQAAASRAKRGAVPSWWSAAALLFLASVLLASTAGAQSRIAAIGLHHAWSTQFYVDGDFDSWLDLAVAFGTSSDIGLLADVTGSGMRSPATYNSGFWHLDTNRDGIVDQTILHGGIGDKPLVADIDRDGRDELAGPSFGIFDASTYFMRTNWVYNDLAFQNTCAGNVCGRAPEATVANAVGTKVDFGPFVAVAADPAALVDMVDNVLLQKSMPTFMRQQIINAVAAYPSATAADRLNRARTAVYLTVSSPRFQTEY